MKKYSILLFFILLVPGSVWSLGRWSETKNLVGFWVDGAYVGQLDNVELTEVPSGVGASLGFTYEFQHKKFIINAGVGAEYNHTGMNVVNSKSSIPGMVDSQGDKCTLNYSFSDRKDNVDMLSLHVPIMLGAQWNRFYFLVGPKFSLCMMGKTKVKSNLSTTAEYTDYIGTWQNMPNHGYVSDVKQTSKGDISFGPQLYGSLEIGFRFGERQWARGQGFNLFYKGKTQQRLALFVDYGFMNQHNNKNLSLIEMPEQTGSTSDAQTSGLKMNHIYNTTAAHNARVNQLRVGIKYTLLFNIESKLPCVICKD